ncbi:MAG: DUF2085 domain-containing protein [Spirochaetes bacterium]|nr:DUF2085 domain-containing protein [Spirochaetota bacterium]
MNKKSVTLFNKIFCHHTKKDADHCIKIKIWDMQLALCSRCLGLYPFSLTWLFLSLSYKIKLSHSFEKNFIIYSLFPAFLDWTLTGLSVIKSNNRIRFFSGLFASFGLARWWYLWIMQNHMDIVLEIGRMYLIGIIVVSLIIFRIKVVSK